MLLLHETGNCSVFRTAATYHIMSIVMWSSLSDFDIRPEVHIRLFIFWTAYDSHICIPEYPCMFKLNRKLFFDRKMISV